MISEKLAERRLPPLMRMNDGRDVQTIDDWRIRRRELLELLQREEYGETPAPPAEVRGEVLSANPDAYAGKAVQETIQLSFDAPGGRFSFPMTLAVPHDGRAYPAFVCIGFQGEVPNRYLPAEEILDAGYAIANFDYQTVTSDGPELDGIAALYPQEGPTAWGVIGMWAFAVSRVLDYLQQRPEIDARRCCVSGHSRLGKTALWCAAQDERFAMVVSNNSGCSGAALSRGKIGESVEIISRVFPYWFCKNYRRWADREFEMPFDQHMLLALVAPRKLYVCSAAEDDWADPESEYLGCAAAEPAWTLYRVPGLAAPDALPEVGVPIHCGGVCYHLRAGKHFFSRTDWQYQLCCREKFFI